MSSLATMLQLCSSREDEGSYTGSLPMFDKPVKYPTGKYTIVVGTFAGNNAAIVQTGQGNKCRDSWLFFTCQVPSWTRSLHGNQRKVWRCSY